MPTLCPNCNYNNPPGMRFCGMCGSLLEGPDAGAPSLNQTPVSQTSEANYNLSSDLLDLLQISKAEKTSQRRNVTILFADLAGYTAMSGKMDTEEIYHIIQEYSRLLATSVIKYDGMVDKFTGDGLMAIFGAPIAQENNAEMAIRAALDMQEGLKRANVEIHNQHGIELLMRVGLNYGSVIVGNIGSAERMEYTAIGNTVNLASRLEQAAKPRTIFISESVYHQTKALFNFESIPPLTIKGVTDLVKCYRVINAKHKPGDVRGLDGLHSKMVGRDSELNQIRSHLDKLTNHNMGSFVLIIGEAGLGKSRLISEFKTDIHRSNVMVHEGNSLNYRRGVSYWIIRDLITHLLNINVTLPESEIHKHLRVSIEMLWGGQTSDVLPYLENMMALKSSDTEAGQRLSLLEPDHLQQRIFIAVRDVLIKSAQNHPLVVILEDLHWADDASLDLISFMIDTILDVPIMFVGVSRPTEHIKFNQMIEKARLHLSDKFTHIVLKNLSPDVSKQLFNHLLNIPEIDERILTAIIEKASGIPFYLEEMIRMLIESNLVQNKEGTWQFVPDVNVASFGIPDNLQGLILTRFDYLPAPQRNILKVASTIGKRFNLSLLRMVVNLADDQVFNDSIKFLTEREFIQPEDNLHRIEYRFKYALVSETIYSTLLRSDQSELHGKIGLAIEELFIDTLDKYVEELARHYYYSMNYYDKALKYLLEAGYENTRSYINDQALQNFRYAIEVLPKCEHIINQELDAYLGLGYILLHTGKYEEARKNYLIALDILLKQSDPKLHIVDHSTVLRQIAKTYEPEGKYDQALLYLEDSQHFLQTAPINDPIEISQTLEDAGWIYIRRGDLDSAKYYLTQALELVKNTRRDDLIASIYNRLGRVHYLNDDLEKAIEYVLRSLEIRIKLGDIKETARSFNNLGLLEKQIGHWKEALEYFNNSIEENKKIGDIENIVGLHINMGLLLMDMGSLKESKSHVDKSLADAKKFTHKPLEGEAYLTYALYYLRANEWLKSIEFCNRCTDIFVEIGSQEHKADIFWCLGEAWFGNGDLEKAQFIYDEALSYLDLNSSSQSEISAERGLMTRLSGKIQLFQGNVVQAETLLKQCLQIFTSLDDQLEIGRCWTAMVPLALAQGDKSLTKSCVQKAYQIFHQLGAKLDVKELERVKSGSK